MDKANISCTDVINTTINSEFGTYEGAPSCEPDTDSSEDSNTSRFVYIGYTVWYEIPIVLTNL